jgi:hypothetical protein
MTNSFSPFTYLRIIFLAFHCYSFGVSMKLEVRLTPYIISGLIIVRYIIHPTNILNSVGSTLDPLSSLLNFNPIMIVVGTAF